MQPGFQVLAIAIGGACGALSRYYIALIANSGQANAFPWGTFFANLLGSFLIGLLLGSGRDQQQEFIRLAFGIGFLGSLTTFSTFSAETVTELIAGNWKMAAVNTVANLGCCLLATAAGIALARKLMG